MGQKRTNYSDGVLATTQAGAVTLARTIINGVSNNARVETIKENADVIDGVKFVGTLDGKTCPYCASLDGYIWRGEEMGQARRPPIHPNCRCTLVPYVELKDEEGNVVEVDSERPAANADFDQLAKEAYNDNAKQNGWNRRWDDLSPSTRLKYYYQAQKDFEAQTGQKAYEQVPASLTFADYFKKQDDQFKRSWLGAKRFQLYKDGKLKEDQIFAPNLDYMATAKELFHISKETQQTAEELEALAKEGGEKIKTVIDTEKKDNTQVAPAQGLNRPYEPIEAEFEGNTNPDKLFHDWSSLPLSKLSDIKKRIIRSRSKWSSLINSAEPKRENYDSDTLYRLAYTKWNYDREYGFVFWEEIDKAFKDAESEVKLIHSFKNPFDSIMEPKDYQDNPKTKKELERIEEQFKRDQKRRGIEEAWQRKRDALHNLILPTSPSNSAIKALMGKMPNEDFKPAKESTFDRDEFERNKKTFNKEAENGLRFTARILANLGIDHNEIQNTKIKPEVLDRPECYDKSIYLGYRIGGDIEQYISCDCVHELGHSTENCLADIKQKVNDFYEKHSRKDDEGNHLKHEIYEGSNEIARELDFETPNIYDRKEYINLETGELTDTELTSMFFQYIIEQPELFFDSRYETYFSGMIQLWKKEN